MSQFNSGLAPQGIGTGYQPLFGTAGSQFIGGQNVFNPLLNAIAPGYSSFGTGFGQMAAQFLDPNSIYTGTLGSRGNFNSAIEAFRQQQIITNLQASMGQGYNTSEMNAYRAIGRAGGAILGLDAESSADTALGVYQTLQPVLPFLGLSGDLQSILNPSGQVSQNIGLLLNNQRAITGRTLDPSMHALLQQSFEEAFGIPDTGPDGISEDIIDPQRTFGRTSSQVSSLALSLQARGLSGLQDLQNADQNDPKSFAERVEQNFRDNVTSLIPSLNTVSTTFGIDPDAIDQQLQALQTITGGALAGSSPEQIEQQVAGFSRLVKSGRIAAEALAALVDNAVKIAEQHGGSGVAAARNVLESVSLGQTGAARINQDFLGPGERAAGYSFDSTTLAQQLTRRTVAGQESVFGRRIAGAIGTLDLGNISDEEFEVALSRAETDEQRETLNALRAAARGETTNGVTLEDASEILRDQDRTANTVSVVADYNDEGLARRQIGAGNNVRRGQEQALGLNLVTLLRQVKDRAGNRLSELNVDGVELDDRQRLRISGAAALSTNLDEFKRRIKRLDLGDEVTQKLLANVTETDRAEFNILGSELDESQLSLVIDPEAAAQDTIRQRKLTRVEARFNQLGSETGLQQITKLAQIAKEEGVDSLEGLKKLGVRIMGGRSPEDVASELGQRFIANPGESILGDVLNPNAERNEYLEDAVRLVTGVEQDKLKEIRASGKSNAEKLEMFKAASAAASIQVEAEEEAAKDKTKDDAGSEGLAGDDSNSLNEISQLISDLLDETGISDLIQRLIDAIAAAMKDWNITFVENEDGTIEALPEEPPSAETT